MWDGKMKLTDLVGRDSVMTTRSKLIRRDVIGKYWAFKFARPLKLILLSSTIGVLGACAVTGTSGGAPDGAGNTARQTRAMASQSVDECLAWDIACLLERPVGALSGGPSPGAGDRGQDGNDGSGSAGSSSGSGGEGGGNDAGRGNGSEGDPDGDPGNSGGNNQGGD